MRMSTICTAPCKVLLPVLLLVLLPGSFAPAMGQTFSNEDTATDRQDAAWGTRQKDDSGGYIGTTERGDADWGTKPAEEKPERNPYDDVIITISPDVSYGTTTTTDTNSTGDITGTHTTTTTY